MRLLWQSFKFKKAITGNAQTRPWNDQKTQYFAEFNYFIKANEQWRWLSSVSWVQFVSPGTSSSHRTEGCPPVAMRMWGAVYFFPLTSTVGSGSLVNLAWPWIVWIFAWNEEECDKTSEKSPLKMLIAYWRTSSLIDVNIKILIWTYFIKIVAINSI